MWGKEEWNPDPRLVHSPFLSSFSAINDHTNSIHSRVFDNKSAVFHYHSPVVPHAHCKEMTHLTMKKMMISL
jgi:hypothetical protein